MVPRVLNVGRLPQPLIDRLQADFRVETLAAQPDARAYLDTHGRGIEAMVTSAAVGVDAALIDALPDLRVICSFGVGLDRIDVEAAHRRGIEVGYTPDVLNDCVADHAMALLLDVARQVSRADRYVRRGHWPQGLAFPLGRKVSGARLGIVGLGRIGRTIARRAEGFEMEVRYHSRRPVPDARWAHEPDLLELARWADFLVVITSGGPSTRHLIDGEVLDALGPKGCLVNVARGSVIDEEALVLALEQGRIGGAGLDVYTDEPHVPARLFELDNVVLTPHIASATEQTRQAMADLVLENLRSFFTTGRVVAPVPKAVITA